MTEDQITQAAAMIEMRLRGRAMAAAAKSDRNEFMLISVQPVFLGVAKGSIETVILPVNSAIALGEWIQQHATMELEKLGVDP